MADDFDLNQYMKQNSQAPKEESGDDSFDPQQYIKDNAQHLQSPVKPPEDQQWSKAESMGQGAVQGATLGFSDEIGGALGALMEKAADVVGKGSGDKKSLQELYEEYRDFQRKRNEDAQKANPMSNLAGQVGGAVGTALLTGGVAAAPELGMLGRAIQPAAKVAAPLLAPKTVPAAAALGAASALGSSNQDLVNPTPQSVVGTGKDLATGAALGALGGAIGQKVAGKLNPEDLEVAASKMASKSVGIKPSRELTRVYDPSTGKMIQGSDVIKGIGKTAMEEGTLPLTGGPSNIYDKSLDAIDKNYQQLQPVMQQAQAKLSEDVPQALEAVGNVGDKSANFLYEFRESLANDPDANKIMDGIEKKYIPYIQNNIVPADGDLTKLMAVKKALQDKATDLSAAAYDQPASDLKPEAEFVKRLGGIVRQHIEDLANEVDPGAGEQIAQTNKKLSDLYSFRDAAKKLMDKGSTGSTFGKVLDIPAKILTDNSTERLAKMATAKVANQTAKAISTPAGQIAQKAVTNIPLSTVTNPFTQGRIQEKYNPSESTRVATNLYNATDDSLKEVASKMTSTPGLQFYGDHLNRAIDTNDVGEKNRAIFLILQNPQSRKLVTPDEQLKEQTKKSLNQMLNR